MPLAQVLQHRVVDRFHGARDEETPRAGEQWKHRRVPQEVLDLDRDVVGDTRKSRREPFDDAPRVRRPVEEIGIAEGDVLGARGDLLADVLEHRIDGNRMKAPLVDRYDRAVTTEMLAAVRRVGAADDASRSVWHLQLRVTSKRRESGTIGDDGQLPVRG